MKQLLGAVALLAALGFFLFHYTPGVLQDLRIQDAAVPAFDLRIEKAKCTTHTFVVTTCSVSYRPRNAAAGSPTQSVESVMLGGSGAERVMLMRSPRDGIVTTDVNMAKLTNRVVTLLAFVGVLALLMGFGAIRLLRGQMTPRLA